MSKLNKALTNLAAVSAITALSLSGCSSSHEKIERQTRRHSTWSKKTAKRRAKNKAAKIARRKNRR